MSEPVLGTSYLPCHVHHPGTSRAAGTWYGTWYKVLDMWCAPAVLQCTTNSSSTDASTEITSYRYMSRICLQNVSLILLPHLSPVIDM